MGKILSFNKHIDRPPQTDDEKLADALEQIAQHERALVICARLDERQALAERVKQVKQREKDEFRVSLDKLRAALRKFTEEF